MNKRPGKGHPCVENPVLVPAVRIVRDNHLYSRHPELSNPGAADTGVRVELPDYNTADARIDDSPGTGGLMFIRTVE
jgi:hypothetical protein